MRDHDFRFCRNLFTPIAIVQISNQAARCTIDVEEIHCIGANAGEFGPLIFIRIATLPFRHNFPNRASANTACSKVERLIKAIV